MVCRQLFGLLERQTGVTFKVYMLPSLESHLQDLIDWVLTMQKYVLLSMCYKFITNDDQMGLSISLLLIEVLHQTP